MDLQVLQSYSEMLANGIDPTSGIQFENDTIMNSERIKEYHREIKSILDKLILIEHKRDTSTRKNSKIPFFLLDSVKKKIVLSEEKISISKLCYIFNGYVPTDMKKIKASDITSILEEKGFLKTVEWRAGREIKIPTEEGLNLGISTCEKTNEYGNTYSVNYYNIDAQRYILHEIL